MLVAFAMSILTAAVLALAILAWVVAREGFSRAQREYFSDRGAAKNQNTTAGAAVADASHGRRRQRILPFAVPVALSVWTMLAWLVYQGRL